MLNLLAMEKAAHWQLQFTNLPVKHIGTLLSDSTLPCCCLWVHNFWTATAAAQSAADLATDSGASGFGRSSSWFIQVIESKTHKVRREIDHWQQELLLEVCAGAECAVAGADELPSSHLEAEQGLHH